MEIRQTDFMRAATREEDRARLRAGLGRTIVFLAYSWAPEATTQECTKPLALLVYVQMGFVQMSHGNAPHKDDLRETALAISSKNPLEVHEASTLPATKRVVEYR